MNFYTKRTLFLLANLVETPLGFLNKFFPLLHEVLSRMLWGGFFELEKMNTNELGILERFCYLSKHWCGAYERYCTCTAEKFNVGIYTYKGN